MKTAIKSGEHDTPHTPTDEPKRAPKGRDKAAILRRMDGRYKQAFQVEGHAKMFIRHISQIENQTFRKLPELPPTPMTEQGNMTTAQQPQRNGPTDEEKNLVRLMRVWMSNPIDGHLGKLAQAMVTFELRARLSRPIR